MKNGGILLTATENFNVRFFFFVPEKSSDDGYNVVDHIKDV